MFFKSGSEIHSFLPWWGLLGMAITLIESYLWGEFNNIIYNYTIDYQVGLLFLGFTVTLVIFTSICPFFIKRYSASMFNVAIVSQIFWSYLVEVICGEATPRTYFYYIGFVVIVIGIFIYNRYPVEVIVESNTYKSMKSEKISINESDTSSCSAFSTDKKYSHIKNNTLQVKANKYLTNN
jgi:hypothetical protein